MTVCVNGPGHGVTPRHGVRVATWFFKFRELKAPICDECKELMKDWEGGTFEPVTVEVKVE